MHYLIYIKFSQKSEKQDVPALKHKVMYRTTQFILSLKTKHKFHLCAIHLLDILELSQIKVVINSTFAVLSARDTGNHMATFSYICTNLARPYNNVTLTSDTAFTISTDTIHTAASVVEWFSLATASPVGENK